jgi:membrane-bound lytic murein transglycosylase D
MKKYIIFLMVICLLVAISYPGTIVGAKESDFQRVEEGLKKAKEHLEEAREAVGKGNAKKAKEKCDLGMAVLLELREIFGGDEYDSLLGDFALLRLKINKMDREAVTGEIAETENIAFPLVWNARVEKWIDHYTVKDREYLIRSLKRSEKYIKMVKEVFRQASLPEDLAYVAIVESGYYPFAQSPKKAVGHWQFLTYTGRANGLKINYWYDERRDPKKSAQGAARELRKLYEKFGSWELALAAYNCGRTRVNREIKRAGTKDYWALTLPRETENYVPKIMAILFIVQEPAVFGFPTNFEEKVAWTEVTVNGCVDLRLAAEAAECSLKEIQEFNPELRQLCTPPDQQEYALKLPPDKEESFLKNFAALPDEKKYLSKEEIEKRKVIVYKVQKGDSLWTIARRYRVSLAQIKKWNNLKSNKIYPHQRLKIYSYSS